jgi:dihydrofolate synthase/folylpolyglutamate synthase
MTITYEQALAYISNFEDPYLAAIRDHGKQTWGLDRIRARLHELGDPHLAYPTIHVAGTKGKGSTSAFIANGLIGSGLKTGLYVSPHLQDWRERISINFEMIPPEALVCLVEDYQEIPSEQTLSAFEVTTALAFWHFARESCNIAVIEVGLGGRLDATSVVEPIVSVITNISFDHTQLLGDTLEQIAGEKAAIIKSGVPVVSGPQEPAALGVIEQRAAEMNSPLTVIGRDWEALPVSLTWNGSEAEIGPIGCTKRVHISLPGAFQVENAAVSTAALNVAQAAGVPVKSEAVGRAMSEMDWPGRLEMITESPLIAIDSAHNPYSISRLIESLEILDVYDRLIFVFGCMADKQSDLMLGSILRAASMVILTQADHWRAAAPEDLLAAATRLLEEAQFQEEGWGESVEVFTSATVPMAVSMAIKAAEKRDAVCIAGSLAVAGEARSVLVDDTRFPSEPADS